MISKQDRREMIKEDLQELGHAICWLPFAAIGFLIMYGGVRIFLRAAFDVEIWNPFG